MMDSLDLLTQLKTCLNNKVDHYEVFFACICHKKFYTFLQLDCPHLPGKMVKEKAGNTTKVGGSSRKSQLSQKKRKKKLSKTDEETNKQVMKVEAIELLVSKYGMTNIGGLLEYDKFFRKYPSGLIKKEEFLEEYKVVLSYATPPLDSNLSCASI